VARPDADRIRAIGVAAGREWYEERFSALYLEETLRGNKEVSVLFADLAGFTPFTEARGSTEVFDMLVAYFGRLAPMIQDEFGGEVHEFVGDQIFSVFNKEGDQPDHALRAARAALALQRVAPRSRRAPEWPVFRVG
jgi:class 3 adenylate cyclase